MRRRITANRRARATIAFFIPGCRLVICIAQALSQDHLQRDILLLRSISPDWYLDHVSPNTAPTALDLRKGAVTSTVAR
jgi:hypothetical protein